MSLLECQETTSRTGGRLSEEVTLELASLVFGFSPRFVPEDPELVRALAELPGEALPAVLVHAATMTVIDGRHRVLAARLRGDGSIRARLHHGNLQEALLMAVELNVPHGKPLTYGEKLHSACLVLADVPETPDSTVADICGLLPKTVNRLRGIVKECTFTASEAHNSSRILSSEVARREARQIMLSFPEESNRSIAREVGLSEATVRAIRHNSTLVEGLSYPEVASRRLSARPNSTRSRVGQSTAPERARCARCAVWLTESLSRARLRKLIRDGSQESFPAPLVETLGGLDELSHDLGM